VRYDREKEEEIGRERKIEGARESQWYQRVGIVYTELIKTSPFNTPFPLDSSRTNTRMAYAIHTYIILLFLNKRAREGKVRERSGNVVTRVRVIADFIFLKKLLKIA